MPSHQSQIIKQANFTNPALGKALEKQEQNEDTLKTLYALLGGKEMVLNTFKIKITPLSPIEATGHPSELVKEDNTSENWNPSNHIFFVSSKIIY